MVSDYDSDRRLFVVMRKGGWAHDQKTGGFLKRVDGSLLWVSWGQAEDALRLADDGEKVAAVAPVSREIMAVVVGAENDL